MKSRLGRADNIFKLTKADKATKERILAALVRPGSRISEEEG